MLTRDLIIERLTTRRTELLLVRGMEALRALLMNGAPGYGGKPINALLDEYTERSLHEVYDDDEDELRALREPMSSAEYAERGGLNCPYCGSDNISGGSFDVYHGGVSQDVSCGECDRSWTDDYTLEGWSKNE